jgi:glucose/arabinose dehydrogenase
MVRGIGQCLLLGIAACGGGGGGDSFDPGGATIELEPAFANLSLSQPVALLRAPHDSSRWFVVEQAGVVRVFDNEASVAASTVFINITGRVTSGGETGLLGMAFDPDFDANRYVYLSYTRSGPLTSVLSRFQSFDGGQTLDPSSETVILTATQPFANHNGGNILFGPDGLLYFGLGDGGSGNDSQNNAQDNTNLLGAMLRIDVSNLPYQIPSTNPFAGNALCGNGGTSPDGSECPEIYAWGLRNPWRFSFDRATGDLWAGDVGQSDWEEVDRISIGGNYGWRDREGAHCNADLYPAGGCPTAGLIDPETEYDHTAGGSVTGGYVYRGAALPALVGSYLFGDFSSGRIFRLAPGAADYEDMLDTTLNISSFGQDIDGELYVLDYGGAIHHIVPSP